MAKPDAVFAGMGGSLKDGPRGGGRWRWARPRSIAVCCVVLMVVGLVASGCGSKKQPISTADFANGVCSAISTWTGSVKSAADSLKGGNVSKSSLQSAAKEVESATATLESDLKSLGEPGTQAGQQAKSLTDQLSSDLKTGINSIKSAVSGASGASGIASAAATVAATLTTMSNQVTSTVNSLKQLGGQVKTAFEQSTACQKLSSSS
jgi:uncharacterized protein YoxC